MQERTAPSSWGEEDGRAEGMNKEPEWCGSFRSPPAHGGAPGCVPAPVGAFSPLPFISSFCSTCRCGNGELCQCCALCRSSGCCPERCCSSGMQGGAGPPEDLRGLGKGKGGITARKQRLRPQEGCMWPRWPQGSVRSSPCCPRGCAPRALRWCGSDCRVI